MQYRTFDSNKSALPCDVFTDANNVHLADMTEHMEFLVEFQLLLSGFLKNNGVVYSSL